MGLEVLMAARDDQRRRSRGGYQRLVGGGGGDGEEVGAAAARWGRARRPLRLRRRAPVLLRTARPGGKFRARLMRLLLLAPARRLAALVAELVRRLAAGVDAAGAECPAIVFSSQWGLPVLSHSAGGGGGARTARLRAFYLERSLSSSSAGGGGGSPC